MNVLISVLLFWVMPLPASINIGRQKGRNGWSWALLGWAGFLCLFIMSEDRKELVEVDAPTCKHGSAQTLVDSGSGLQAASGSQPSPAAFTHTFNKPSPRPIFQP